jgi:hypothetical protein
VQHWNDMRAGSYYKSRQTTCTVYDNVRAALELRAPDFQQKIKTHNDASNDEALRIQTSLAETMTTVKTDNIPNIANGMMKV